jgi:glycosyltransferase involved in cell wall biosynthesis
MIKVKKIKLAVVFDQIIYAGGGYQQSINAALVAQSLREDLVDVIFYTTEIANLKMLKDIQISARLIKLSWFEKIRIFFYRKIKSHYLFNIFRSIEKINPREKVFINDNIDLIYFLSPTSWPVDIENINFITTVWDLCHRDHPEFPEVRMNREFERRENNYETILKKATAIIVDSEETNLNIIKRYGIDQHRVNIIPFQAGYETKNSVKKLNFNEMRIKNKFKFNKPYIFYPAQFWSHKNHVYLLKGLKLLEKDYGIVIEIVFCGKDKGNLKYIKDQAIELKILDRVHFLGFVSNSEILEIYSQAIALVMPTHFGPTNMPPLEAFEIGVPVIYSDIKGSKEQLGDAALYVDLKHPSSLANQLKRLMSDEILRKKMINEGKKKAEQNNSIDRSKILESIIEEFQYKKDSWN